MVTPTIALRFRDTVLGVDTISEHLKLLEQNGRVGWGWWKKPFENVEPDKIIAAIDREKEIGVTLLDRSTRRTFQCVCTAFFPGSTAQPDLAPEYYRAHLREIAGLFVLTSIVEIDFDANLAGAIQEQTFLWVGEHADPAMGHTAPAAKAKGRSCLLHLSDLHFGDDYGFRLQDEQARIGDIRQTLTRCIVSDLQRLGLHNDIAAIVVTGDFVTKGTWSDKSRSAALAEFEALRQELKLGKDQVIAVPGNHDVVRYPDSEDVDVRENAVEKQTTYQHETMFRTFVDELMGRSWKASLNFVRRIHLDTADIDICVLNSCTIAATKWTEYGYVGNGGLDAVAELSKFAIDRSTFRFIALHHHLLPVADVEEPHSKGVTLTLDAADVLATAQRHGVHIALHGHQHKPKIATYNALALNGEQNGFPIHVIANGSASARNSRLPPGEHNTYCLFKVDGNDISLWIRELRVNGAAGAQTFFGKLQCNPAVPRR